MVKIRKKFWGRKTRWKGILFAGLSPALVAVLVGGLLLGCRTDNKELQRSSQPMNVLFIAVDDLRPELGCYGIDEIKTPHIDRLAGRGFLFEQAFCNVPVCGASRASILSGLRPTANRFLAHNSYLDQDAPGVTTLAEHFKNHGYHTLSIGKVLHHWQEDALVSWSEKPWHPRAFAPGSPGRQRLNYALAGNIDKRPPFEQAEVADSVYHDGKIAIHTVQKLQALAREEVPFFLAAGFVKPHLPFNAPAKYWELYDPKTFAAGTSVPFPVSAPPEAYHHSAELRTYDGIPAEGLIPDSLARQLIHGYYACVSFVDAQIGLILQELEKLELADRTIVVLWGDHGWSLGEHDLWCKHSTFGVAMQAPLIVSIPGRKGGRRVESLVEFVDIYPSLVELTGLPQPSHLQGESFVDLLDDPNAEGKKAVYGRWKNAEVVRTRQHSYTEWSAEDGSMRSRMLFDLREDPHETRNIAELPERADHLQKISEYLSHPHDID